MKKICFATSLMFIALHSISQSKNTLNLEFFGKSVIYSLSYERHLFEKANKNISVSFGFGILPLKNVQVYSLPANIYYNIGLKTTKLELIGGMTYLMASQRNDETKPFRNSAQLLLSTGIGIKKTIGKFNLRANFTPLWGLYQTGDGELNRKFDDKNQVFFNSTLIFNTPVAPTFGISVGYSF